MSPKALHRGTLCQCSGPKALHRPPPNTESSEEAPYGSTDISGDDASIFLSSIGNIIPNLIPKNSMRNSV